MTSPFRTNAPPPEEEHGPSWPVLDAEIVIAAVSVLVLAVGIGHRRFGVPETLAMLALFGTVRAIVTAILDAPRENRKRDSDSK